MLLEQKRVQIQQDTTKLTEDREALRKLQADTEAHVAEAESRRQKAQKEIISAEEIAEKN